MNHKTLRDCAASRERPTPSNDDDTDAEPAIEPTVRYHLKVLGFRLTSVEHGVQRLEASCDKMQATLTLAYRSALALCGAAVLALAGEVWRLLH
jgi:hypothetical protein